MTDIEQQVRDGLRDEHWDLAPHPDPRDAITAIARKRRRARGVGAVVGAAALVTAAVVVPNLIDSSGSTGPIATGPSHTTTSSPATTDTTGAGDPTDSAAPVLLEPLDFELVPGQVFDKYESEIKFNVFSPMCDPVEPGSIEPRTTLEPGVFKVALYAVATEETGDPRCAGGIATTRYTIHLLMPLLNRDVVVDHSPPDNPPNAVAVPAGASPHDYVDADNPDLSTWTVSDNGAGLSLWYKGVADSCDPPTGYLSLLFPNDGTATFVPTRNLDDPALPGDAMDTGWRAGPVQLWTARDYSAAYLVVNGATWRWDKAPQCVYDSFDGRSG